MRVNKDLILVQNLDNKLSLETIEITLDKNPSHKMGGDK